MRSGPREIIFVAVLIAIPLGTWWSVIRPRNARAAQMYQAIHAKQAELKALNRTKDAIGDLKKEITDLTKAIAFFESKLPNEKEIDKVLHSLWQLAKSNKLVTKGIRTQDRRNSADAALASQHCDQPIAMQLEGDFMRFYAFLQALENQPRIMRIREMKIIQGTKAPEGYIQAEFTISVFFETSDDQRQWRSKN